MSKPNFYFLLIALLSLTMGCTKNNDTNPDDPDKKEIFGEPHSYQFTFTGGHYDGQTFSGEFENPEDHLGGNSVVYVERSGDFIDISFFLENEEVSWGGDFLYHPSTKVTEELTLNPIYSNNSSGADSSNFGITFKKEDVGAFRNYLSLSGTMALAKVKLNNNKVDGGLVSCEASFNGTFISTGQDDTVSVSGKIILNMQPEQR